MTIEQKTTWMRCLTLGTSLFAIAIYAIFSCKEEKDYLVKGTFVYVNNTDSLIEIKNGPYIFTVNSKDTYTIEQMGDGSKEVTEKSYVAPYAGGQIIIYGKKMCDTLLVSKEGIAGIENYKSEKIGDRNYKFTYTFTDIDYKKALPCK